MSIKFYLQPNPITPDPNDQSARVVANQTLDTEALIALILKRGTLVTETDLRAVLTIFFDEVASQVANGNAVLLPLVNLRPGIKGVFANITDTFDSHRHTKRATISPGTLLIKKMTEAQVEKIIGSAETKISIFATRTEGTLLFSIPSPLAAGSYTLEVRKGSLPSCIPFSPFLSSRAPASVCHESKNQTMFFECCINDGSRSTSIGLQWRVLNHLKVRCSKGRVLSVQEKARLDRVRCV